MKTRKHQWAVLAAAALIVACSGKDEGGSPESQPSSSGEVITASKGAAIPLEKRLQNIGALSDLIVGEASDLPRAEFAPAALVAAVGNDPQKLFEWVRDRTWWAPYRGLLRGPKGVMLDRMGSSLDRAVLLGELLRRAGYTVRLAHAQLSEDTARQQMSKVRPIPAQRRAPSASREMSAQRRRAMAALDPRFEEAARRNAKLVAQHVAASRSLVRSQADALLTAVRDASAGSAPSDSAAIAAIRDHWWVERNDGGRWVAMDVLSPELDVGNRLTPAQSVSDWLPEANWPSIPDADWHSVRLKVVVEQYNKGSMREFTALERTLRPAELLGQPVSLGNSPKPRVGAARGNERDQNAFRTAAMGITQWVPYLQIGSEVIVGSGFDNSGNQLADPLSSSGDIAKTGGAEAAGNFADALGGFGPDPNAPSATAEWLDFEIGVPGSAPEHLRRTIFDLLGPAKRNQKVAEFDGNADLPKMERAEGLLSLTDILLQPCSFTAEFVTDMALAPVVANKSALAALARQTDAAEARRQAGELFGRIGLAGPLPTYVLWRSALGEGDWYIHRPNVLNYRIGRLVQRQEVVVRRMIDVASNSIDLAPAANRTPFERRLRQGVSDTVAEMLVLGVDQSAAANTASVFSRLDAGGVRGLLINAGDHAAAAALPWPDDELARVAEDVDAGFLALVPRQAVQIEGEQHVGWWRVHPVSGDTIGVMDTGFHAGTAENSALRKATAALLDLMTDQYAYRQALKKAIAEGVELTAEQEYWAEVLDALWKLQEELAWFRAAVS